MLYLVTLGNLFLSSVHPWSFARAQTQAICSHASFSSSCMNFSSEWIWILSMVLHSPCQRGITTMWAQEWMWCQPRLVFIPVNKLQPTVRLLNFPFFSLLLQGVSSLSPLYTKLTKKKKLKFSNAYQGFASLDIIGLSTTYIIALNKITLCVFAKHIRSGQVSHQNRF